jgi:hypothetical protein
MTGRMGNKMKSMGKFGLKKGPSISDESFMDM